MSNQAEKSPNLMGVGEELWICVLIHTTSLGLCCSMAAQSTLEKLLLIELPQFSYSSNAFL